MERTGVGLVACDEHGELTLLSPPLQELFGIGFAPIAEAALPEVFHLCREDGVTPLPVEEMPLARARAGEYVADAVIGVRDRHGRQRFLRCNAAPLERHGQCRGAIALVQDVTSELEEAATSDRLHRRLVQVVDHEFRTPLTALLGHLEVVRDHLGGEVSPDLARSLEAVERAGWRLRDLVCRVSGLIERDADRHRAGRTADGAPLRAVGRPAPERRTG
ncbi:histidine kinase dimerization/phospho-acceptor domain-containing protein [Nocardioides flavescens]|uniref:histidine kinase n=1 Tax=Nocardioides flavescens TaxID=2691959 RepID=A0A6L7ES16_9ACTN|nr:histidine kinase dimerization/phospho-acceptor domain-containing protein [Nocardioides flavescens]MXG90103.1 PAS domain-containing protein [Nocardioides flavescens]